MVTFCSWSLKVIRSRRCAGPARRLAGAVGERRPAQADDGGARRRLASRSGEFRRIRKARQGGELRGTFFYDVHPVLFRQLLHARSSNGNADGRHNRPRYILAGAAAHLTLGVDSWFSKATLRSSTCSRSLSVVDRRGVVSSPKK